MRIWALLSLEETVKQIESLLSSNLGTRSADQVNPVPERAGLRRLLNRLGGVVDVLKTS